MVLTVAEIAFAIIILAMLVPSLAELRAVGTPSWHLFERSQTDTLRGIAILMVILSHLNQFAGSSVSLIRGGHLQALVGTFGALGVAIFLFLSGYGNYISLSHLTSKSQVLRKTGSHIVRLLVVYAISWLVVTAADALLAGHVDWSETFKGLIALRMPGTSTWYVKVQLLMYAIMAIAFVALSPRWRTVGIALPSLLWVGIACTMGLPDFWWKTSLCFWAGALVAKWHSCLESIILVHRVRAFVLLLLACAFAYLWVVIDHSFIVVPQLASYVVLAACIACEASLLRFDEGWLIRIGRASLALYLVHIGLLSTVYAMGMNPDIESLVFLGLTAMLTFVVRWCEMRAFRK